MASEDEALFKKAKNRINCPRGMCFKFTTTMNWDEYRAFKATMVARFLDLEERVTQFYLGHSIVQGQKFRIVQGFIGFNTIMFMDQVQELVTIEGDRVEFAIIPRMKCLRVCGYLHSDEKKAVTSMPDVEKLTYSYEDGDDVDGERDVSCAFEVVKDARLNQSRVPLPPLKPATMPPAAPN